MARGGVAPCLLNAFKCQHLNYNSRVRETQRGREMIQVEKRTENSVGLQAGSDKNIL